MHYKLYRYLRTPCIDAGEGDVVCKGALKVGLNNVLWFKDRHLKTICMDEVTKDQMELVFPLLADGGSVITLSIGQEAVKFLRKQYRYQRMTEGPFTIIKRLCGSPGEQPAPLKKPANGRKKVLLIRYGAIGDHLMVSPLIQHYHDEGWHVTYNVSENGEKIYEGDPRIDDLMVQQMALINPDRKFLDAYWKKLEAEYDKVVSLVECVEGDLLRIEGTPQYNDSWIKRQTECSGNYIDHHFERAGLDIKGRLPAIWLSDAEKAWAKQEVETVRRKMGKKFIVLWNVFGSSWHKAYPWMFDVWTLLKINRDDIGVIAVSDNMGKYVVGNDFSSVVWNGGAKYKIRQSLALHSTVDAVVTPETWSMTAALGFPAPMIALLSHSSRSNISARPQDVLLEAPLSDCPCKSCHQLHYSRIACPRGVGNRDATLCMDSIPPGDLYQELIKIRSAHEHHLGAA
jgi:hypothetical protein